MGGKWGEHIKKTIKSTFNPHFYAKNVHKIGTIQSCLSIDHEQNTNKMIMQQRKKGAFTHAFQGLYFVFCNSYDHKKTHFVNAILLVSVFCIL